MAPAEGVRRRGPLLSQLQWFVRLRWVAGATVILGSLLDWRELSWYARSPWMAGLGVVVIGYNLLLWKRMGRIAGGTRGKVGKAYWTQLVLFAWVQILLDLLCLMLLVVWTGGVRSPLLGFFVFHMVFASLLLPRMMAYGGAAAAILMMGIGLGCTDQWPGERDQLLTLNGWVITMLLTIYLTNRITMALRRQRKRLLTISRELRKNREGMIQHEKMVAVGQMAAGVAHEIANPLASMDSVLQLMQRNPQRARPEAVKELREQVDRINQIIRLMKNFAHPAEMQMQVMGLNEAVEQSIAMVAFDRRVKRARIERNYAADAGELKLIPQALQQVLVNLILNAMDAMDETSDPTLVVRTSRHEGWCEVEVTDNGPGIRPEHMKRLFEPFFTTKPTGKGTGLGLAISYSLVRKQGGSIAVRSQPGKGASFMVRLPAGGKLDAPRRDEGAKEEGVGAGGRKTEML